MHKIVGTGRYRFFARWNDVLVLNGLLRFMNPQVSPIKIALKDAILMGRKVIFIRWVACV